MGFVVFFFIIGLFPNKQTLFFIDVTFVPFFFRSGHYHNCIVEQIPLHRLARIPPKSVGIIKKRCLAKIKPRMI